MATDMLPNPIYCYPSQTSPSTADFYGNRVSAVFYNRSFRRKNLYCWRGTSQKLNYLIRRRHLCPSDEASIFRQLPLRCQSSDDFRDVPASSVTEEEDEAREAVSAILREFGASEEDSVDIALRSPKYVAMLIDSVRELDELSLWNSGEVSFSSLREKVNYIAKEKGDRGRIPYLESLGLSLPSATHLARYLSSQTLSDLIHKVKYVKEIFFSDSDDDGIIGLTARRMMTHLSISVDDDVQQTLSFFEKIGARRGGLDMLGSGDAAFRYLIESFPRLLLLPLESHMKPMVDFLELSGVPRPRMRNVLLLFPPIIFYDVQTDVKLRIQAFEKAGEGNKDLGRMLLKYPWILSMSIQRNYKEVLSFFDSKKVPRSYVDLAIKRWPLLLGSSVSKLRLMVEQFDDLGVIDKKLGQVISTSPQLLLRKPQEFLQVVSFLSNLGLDEEDIGRVLGRCPEVFASSIEGTLKKKVQFLTAIGVSESHLPRVIRKYPDFFVCDVDKALLPRIRYLKKAGLSRKDVAFMIRRFSPLLGYSIENVLRPKLDFLVNTMRKPLKDVVAYPRYLSYSLEKKIKPRYMVLQHMNVDCSLEEMLGKNDEEFASQFMGSGRIAVPPPSSTSMGKS